MIPWITSISFLPFSILAPLSLTTVSQYLHTIPSRTFRSQNSSLVSTWYFFRRRCSPWFQYFRWLSLVFILSERWELKGSNEEGGDLLVFWEGEGAGEGNLLSSEHLFMLEVRLESRVPYLSRLEDFMDSWSSWFILMFTLFSFSFSALMNSRLSWDILQLWRISSIALSLWFLDSFSCSSSDISSSLSLISLASLYFTRDLSASPALPPAPKSNLNPLNSFVDTQFISSRSFNLNLNSSTNSLNLSNSLSQCSCQKGSRPCFPPCFLLVLMYTSFNSKANSLFSFLTLVNSSSNSFRTSLWLDISSCTMIEYSTLGSTIEWSLMYPLFLDVNNPLFLSLSLFLLFFTSEARWVSFQYAFSLKATLYSNSFILILALSLTSLSILLNSPSTISFCPSSSFPHSTLLESPSPLSLFPYQIKSRLQLCALIFCLSFIFYCFSSLLELSRSEMQESLWVSKLVLGEVALLIVGERVWKRGDFGRLSGTQGESGLGDLLFLGGFRERRQFMKETIKLVLWIRVEIGVLFRFKYARGVLL